MLVLDYWFYLACFLTLFYFGDQRSWLLIMWIMISIGLYFNSRLLTGIIQKQIKEYDELRQQTLDLIHEKKNEKK